jgi:hypothetical protein
MALLLSILFWAALLAGCATTPAPSPDAAGTPSGKLIRLSGSFLEINYVRGNNRHRFIATVNGDSVRAECYRDKQLLKARKMDPGKFEELVQQALTLVNTRPLSSTVTATSPCRTPFTLRLKNEDAIKTLDGCRSTDQGVALGKLIKDAEFLVFSEN